LNVLTISNALLITFCVPYYYDDIHVLVGLADGADSSGNSVSRNFLQPTFVSLLQNSCISVYTEQLLVYRGSLACVRVRLYGHATNWNRSLVDSYRGLKLG
jgi:hypothetical protein